MVQKECDFGLQLVVPIRAKSMANEVHSDDARGYPNRAGGWQLLREPFSPETCLSTGLRQA